MEASALKTDQWQPNKYKKYNRENNKSETKVNVKTDAKGCHHCGKRGHYKRDCWNLHGKPARPAYQKANVVKNNENEETPEDDVCFNIGSEKLKLAWYIDSGASNHMCSEKSFFTNLQTTNTKTVTLANGKRIKVLGMGDGTISHQEESGKLMNIKIKNVLYVPELKGNLLSVKMLTIQGYIVIFKNNICEINKNNDIIIKGTVKDSLYEISEPNKKATAYLSKCDSQLDCIHLWHKRMGHRDPIVVAKLNGKYGVKLNKCDNKIVCRDCVLHKTTRKGFKNKVNVRKTKPLDLIHTDVCGPMQIATQRGSRYMLTMIDDYSRYTTVYFIKNKSEVTENIRNYVNKVENKFSTKVKMIKSDRGGEYVNVELKNFLQSKGIEHVLGAPYTPEQNGLAERRNRSIIEATRCMLSGSNLSKKYWAEAANTAVYIQNRLPNSSSIKPPIELWENRAPELNKLKVFGSKAYMLIPKELRKKLDPKCKELTMIGYDEGCRGYRLLDTNTDKIYISRNVVFDEFPEMDFNNVVKNKIVNNDVTETSNEPTVEENIASKHSLPTRTSRRENKGKASERLIETAYNIYNTKCEPLNYKEAMTSQDKQEWQQAIDNEYQSLIKNETWKLCYPPDNCNIIGNKWVFKQKINETGEICRYKARLVAKGYTQEYGVDYEETFAPVAKQETLRILLSIAHEKRMKVKHFDIETAFLNGELEDEIYMQQPEGFINDDPRMVCKLQKGIYGLKQSAKVWNDCIHAKINRNGFIQSQADPCLYYKTDKTNNIYLLVYVDDLIAVYNDDKKLDEVIKDLGKELIIKDLGQLKFFLGLEFQRDDMGYSICQSIYIKRLIQKYRLMDAREKTMPMNPEYTKTMYEGVQFEENSIYRAAIGELLYIAISTRPDIAMAMSSLSRKLANPTQNDWNQVKGVLCYLKRTSEYKLHLTTKGNGKNELEGYADASWGNDVLDRKSNSGYVFKLNGSTISWKANKQSNVALSSTEAEFISLVEACKEGKWILSMLKELNFIPKDLCVIKEDNQSCLNMIKNGKHSNRTKHIDVKYNFLKECREQKTFDFVYCPTGEMYADCLTKITSGIKIDQFNKWIGLN